MNKSERNFYLFANWKMNGDKAAYLQFVQPMYRHLLELDSGFDASGIGDEGKYGDNEMSRRSVRFCLFPSFIHISLVRRLIDEVAANELGRELCVIGGQTCSPHDNGAYTGEVSAKMLKEYECTYCILNHSESSSRYSDIELCDQISMCAQNAITPILCVGERANAESTLRCVVKRLGSSVFNDMIVAYEPYSAIGSGVIPSEVEINSMIAFIRTQIEDRTEIIYGGSVNEHNCKRLMRNCNISGFLIGGASQSLEKMQQISTICSENA